MRTVSAVIAALLSVTALAPAAFAANPNTADARVTSELHASVMKTATNNGPLRGTLESLEGMPLGAGNDLRARVSASNTSDAALEEVVLRLDVTRSPLATREQLAEFMADPASVPVTAAVQEPPIPEPEDNEDEDEDAANRASNPVGSETGSTTDSTTDADADDTDHADQEPPAPVGERIEPDGATTFTLTASAADLGLPTQGWGVYGASLTLVGKGHEVLVDSFPLTWGARDVPQLDLAVLATAQGVPSRVLSVLEASNLPGVAVAVDPTHLTTANVISTELRDREVFRLPVHTPDLTSIAHSGNDNLVPLALSLPGSNDISVVSSVPWLAIPAAIDTQSVGLATDLDASGVLALPGATGFDRLTAITSAPLVRAEGTPVLLPDAALSTTVAQFRPGAPAASAFAVADSALLAGESDGAPALVALDSAWHIGAGAQSSLSALLDAPWVSPMTVTELLEEPGNQARLRDDLDTTRNLPSEQVERLGSRLDQLTLLATVTDFPEATLNEWGRELLQGISVDARGDEFVRNGAFESALERADATLTAVRIADSSDLNLLTETGDIPVTVVNGLDHTITVTVDLTSFSSNLQVLDSPTVTVPPATDQVVLVPVEAVSNANVFVAAALRNADAEPVSDTRPFSVRVRADWGNAATAVFTVVLILLLVAGLIRTVRRGRKDTREEPSTPPETMVGDDG